MSATITCTTLGVRDLKRSLRFYRALGFKPGFISKEVIFIQLNGSILSLFGAEDLAKDAGLAKGKARPGGITLAINLPSKKAVDAKMAKARKAGAAVLRSPHDAFWGGYSVYFADPDGHPWELAWNPFWSLDKKGNVSLK
jgi:catechol 2,3-dioxygenase-like lactoylglutathione lyase family enzyme